MLRNPSRMLVLAFLVLAVSVAAYSETAGNSGNHPDPNKEAPQPPGAVSNHAKTAEVVAAVEALYATLDEDLLEQVKYDLDDEKRRNWSNLPANITDFERNGIRMGDLNEEQRASVFAVLETSLSTEGFEKVRRIVRADEILAQSSPRAARFGWTEDNYWFAVFGAPSVTEAWSWQFGGHHLAVNVTIDEGRMFLSPTFLGVEPATFEDGGETFAPLQAELEGGLALVQALDETQQAAAIVTDRPREVYAGAGRDGVVPPTEGALAGEWSSVQQDMLVELIDLWVGMLPETEAEARHAEIAPDLHETRFAWHGPVDGSGSVYYRIQGPRLLIEFSTQGNIGDDAGHNHSVYRDPTREYGGTL
ncbi:MAG: DUF3500 domain-containing protein [Bacteroidetes bacterium SB0662_bin_6]|nr:DUF3500 domain-containing protein [Bacteroidetes bacterium SB0668_bin_1]MYE05546.1 DUF3500 domain-containing protein [Bacteroidetes bacterium SB0662_bin_6]